MYSDFRVHIVFMRRSPAQLNCLKKMVPRPPHQDQRLHQYHTLVEKLLRSQLNFQILRIVHSAAEISGFVH